MLFDSIVFARNYDIFVCFYHVALKSNGYIIVFQYPVNVKSRGVVRKIYIVSVLRLIVRFAGKNNVHLTIDKRYISLTQLGG